MNKAVFIIYFVFLIISCKEAKEIELKDLRWLGDIPFDSNIDNANIKLCNTEDQVFQYFNLGDNIEIEGEKDYILETFRANYDAKNAKKESGLVRIRFIVNCKGETDRFRLLTSKLDYIEYEMDSNITDQLMKITKSLKGWKTKYQEGQAVDYYQFLIFRMINGDIVKIMP